MPTPLADKSIVLAAIIGTANAQRTIMTSHYQYDNAGGSPDYVLVMDELRAALGAAGDIEDDLTALAHNSWTWDYWMFQPVYPTRLAKVTYTVNRTGAIGGTGVPQNVCPVITRKGAPAARWSVSAWHGPPFAASSQTGGILSAGLVAALEGVRDDLIAPRTLLTQGAMNAVIWNRTVPSRVTQIENGQVQDTVRVMRRRTVRVGV